MFHKWSNHQMSVNSFVLFFQGPVEGRERSRRGRGGRGGGGVGGRGRGVGGGGCGRGGGVGGRGGRGRGGRRGRGGSSSFKKNITKFITDLIKVVLVEQENHCDLQVVLKQIGVVVITAETNTEPQRQGYAVGGSQLTAGPWRQ